jgi:hypothetical protein
MGPIGNVPKKKMSYALEKVAGEVGAVSITASVWLFLTPYASLPLSLLPCFKCLILTSYITKWQSPI